MKNRKSIQILNSLLDINNERAIIYSLVKDEIIYDDLKETLAACIKKSELCRAQLAEERNRMGTLENNETNPHQEFFKVWLEINECLSKHKRERISSLFTASENIFKTTYANALRKDNSKHLSFRHKSLIWKQNELIKAN